MYGKNDIAKTRTVEQGFKLNSMFYTIQGEGPWAGRPTIFVRFSDCNLRCFFCDTEFSKGDEITADDLKAKLMAMAHDTNCYDVVLTGGEPMLQPLYELIRRTPDKMKFQIETAGTVWPDFPDQSMWRVTIVCSPKTPKLHEKVIPYIAALKYILRDGEVSDADGLPVMSTQKEGASSLIYRKPPYGQARVYVQACDEGNQTMESSIRTQINQNLATQTALKYGYYLSVQIHKIIGVD